MTALTQYEPVSPSSEDSNIARDSSRTLSRFVSKNLKVQISGTEDTVELPASAMRLLVDLLSTMAEGNAVFIVPLPLPPSRTNSEVPVPGILDCDCGDITPHPVSA